MTFGNESPPPMAVGGGLVSDKHDRLEIAPATLNDKAEAVPSAPTPADRRRAALELLAARLSARRKGGGS